MRDGEEIERGGRQVIRMANLHLSEGAELTADDAAFLTEMGERTIQTGLRLQEKRAKIAWAEFLAPLKREKA